MIIERLLRPDIVLAGSIDQDLLNDFLEQCSKLSNDASEIVISLTTQGGDADIGRRIAQHLRLLQRQGHDVKFVGITTVFSAGVTIMASVPRLRRYLTRDTELLIHERQYTDGKPSNGPISAALQMAQSKVAELETAVELQWQGFAELIDGSDVSDEELRRRAATNWYLTAEESLKRRLVAELI